MGRKCCHSTKCLIQTYLKCITGQKNGSLTLTQRKQNVLFFSTYQAADKPCIVFNNENVKFVENHKHLGVTFSQNCKWHCHIENIQKSTSIQLSMLRKFEFTLSRHNLETIYFTYILPLLEYACELWDGCTQQEYNKIEQIQHEAARIICICICICYVVVSNSGFYTTVERAPTVLLSVVP